MTRREIQVRLGETGRSFAVHVHPRLVWLLSGVTLGVALLSAFVLVRATERLRILPAIWFEEQRRDVLNSELEDLRRTLSRQEPTSREVDTLVRRMAARYGRALAENASRDSWRSSTLLLDDLFPLRSEGSELSERSRNLSRTMAEGVQRMGDLSTDAEASRRHWDMEPSILPARGRWSSGFGYRIHPITGVWTFHEGVDLSNNVGTPVRATARGRVVETKYSTSYGNFVRVRHSGHVETVYAHLSAFRVAVGDTVERNQLIALMGNTGRSTGPHVHYEVRIDGKQVNPRSWVLPLRIFP